MSISVYVLDFEYPEHREQTETAYAYREQLQAFLLTWGDSIHLWYYSDLEVELNPQVDRGVKITVRVSEILHRQELSAVVFIHNDWELYYRVSSLIDTLGRRVIGAPPTSKQPLRGRPKRNRTFWTFT